MTEWLVKFRHSNEYPYDNDSGITVWATNEEQAKRAARVLLPGGPNVYATIVSIELMIAR